MKQVNTLNYKLKNATQQFLCALCGNDREVKFKRTLDWRNYLQMVLVASVLTLLAYPWFELKGLFIFPIVWLGFEVTLKMLFRKDLPCPHCGFDPVWYCKDVRVAKSRVKSFWTPENEEIESVPGIEEQNQ